MEEEPAAVIESIRAALWELPDPRRAPEDTTPATVVAVGRIALLDAVVVYKEDATP